MNVPNDVDSAAIFKIIPPEANKRERFFSSSADSNCSETSHIRALDKAVADMETDNEIEIAVTLNPSQAQPRSKHKNKT